MNQLSYPRCSMVLEYLYTYIYPKNGRNVGKYSSTMEHLGIDNGGYETANPILTTLVFGSSGHQEVFNISGFVAALRGYEAGPTKKGGLTLDVAASRVLNTHNFQYLTVNSMNLLLFYC